MKEISDEYTAREEAPKKKPAELFHIWRDGGQHWYYTSGDVGVSFDCGDGNGLKDYIPATINRSIGKYDSTLDVTQMSIYVGYIEDPAIKFIAINPVEILWISVMRIHRDQVPIEASVIFIGQIKGVKFQGINAEGECVGFEFFLKMPIPKLRYQITCNWQLFEARTLSGFTYGCRLNKALYKDSAVITLDSTKTILTAALFGTHSGGYYTDGLVEFGDESRTIISHIGTQIIIAYPMIELVGGNTVDAYPGCDGRPETCRDKFNNVVNSLWPGAFTPEDNPVIRT